MNAPSHVGPVGPRPIVAVVGPPQRRQEHALQPARGQAARHRPRRARRHARPPLRRRARASAARTRSSTPAASIPRATTRWAGHPRAGRRRRRRGRRHRLRARRRRPTPPAADRAAVELLRRADKPVDLRRQQGRLARALEAEALDLYRLGIDELFPVSALHGRGIGELEAAIVDGAPARGRPRRSAGERRGRRRAIRASRSSAGPTPASRRSCNRLARRGAHARRRRARARRATPSTSPLERDGDAATCSSTPRASGARRRSPRRRRASRR